jgi:hypothetical protein|tara:strand:- start:382 stop:627 length:246 start_codon:yes stop_codon:yes gene_type:complete
VFLGGMGMKFLYVDVDNRKVVGLFRNSNEEIIKLNMRELQILAQKERYILNSNILPELLEALKAMGQYRKANRPWYERLFW